MGSSKQESTTKNKTGKLSAEGMSWDSLTTEGIIAYMQDFGGYDVNSEEVTEYRGNDQGRAETYQASIDLYEQKLLDMDVKIAKAQSGGKATSAEVSALELQKARIARKMTDEQKKLNKLQKVTYTKYDLVKKKDAREQAAIDQYGEGSPEALAVSEEIKQAEVQKVTDLADVEKTFLTSLKKYANGDMSYTPEQKEQVANFFAPVKDLINSTADQLLTLADESYDALSSELDGIVKEIDNTGLAFADAVSAASVQMNKGADNLLSVLKTATASQEAKAQFAFDLQSAKIDEKNARQSALLGLPPGSMAEKVQSLKEKSDALTGIRLGLAEMETTATLGIEGERASNLNKLSLANIDFANQQGSKKEGVAQSRYGLTSNYYNSKANTISNQGSALLGVAGQEGNMLYDAAYGSIPGRMQAASGGSNFFSSQNAQNATLNQGLLSPAAGQLSVEQQRTFAENTSKTNQTSTPSFFDTFTGLVGAGAGVASSVMTGYGAATGAGATKNFFS